ncbi:MAG: hypothetical protein ACON4N_07360 [Myxococcota bacterium]
MESEEPTPEDPPAKELIRTKAWPEREVIGDGAWRSIGPRLLRRPAGNSVALWMRVAGEDPLKIADPAGVRRKTVYADGRYQRLKVDALGNPIPKDGARPREVLPPGVEALAREGAGRTRFGDVALRPTDAAPRPADTHGSMGESSSASGNRGEDLIPPGFRDLPMAGADSDRPDNMGEELIPPGFRNLPTAAPKPPPRPKPVPQHTPSEGNLGEELIPPGFRNLPTAAPAAPKRTPRKEPAKVPESPPPAAEPKPKRSSSGRVRTAPARRRTRMTTRRILSTPETPKAAPKTAPEPDMPPPPGPMPQGLDDLFGGGGPPRTRDRLQRTTSKDETPDDA